MTAPTPLAVTGNADADGLVQRDPLALLLGMLLDQQVPMEWAFMAPYSLEQRLGHLDVTRIVAAGPEALTAAFCAKPALHRYPASMATRAYALCQTIVDEYGGRAGRRVARGRDRRRALPPGASAAGFRRREGQDLPGRVGQTVWSHSARLGRTRPTVFRIAHPVRSPTSTDPKRSNECVPGRNSRRRKARASKIERPNGMRTARYEVAWPKSAPEVPIYARGDLCPPLPH